MTRAGSCQYGMSAPAPTIVTASTRASTNHLQDGHLDDRVLSWRPTVRNCWPAPGVVDMCFTGTTCCDGKTFEGGSRTEKAALDFAQSTQVHLAGWPAGISGGEYRLQPGVVQSLQEAVNSGDYAMWKKHSAIVTNVLRLPCAICLPCVKASRSTLKVEPAEPFTFDSAGMSSGPCLRARNARR